MNRYRRGSVVVMDVAPMNDKELVECVDQHLDSPMFRAVREVCRRLKYQYVEQSLGKGIEEKAMALESSDAVDEVLRQLIFYRQKHEEMK